MEEHVGDVVAAEVEHVVDARVRDASVTLALPPAVSGASDDTSSKLICVWGTWTMSEKKTEPSVQSDDTLDADVAVSAQSSMMLLPELSRHFSNM